MKNYIQHFIAWSKNSIYMEVVGENNRINLNAHIQSNCRYGNFFTSQTSSNSNTNNMDNLVMVNIVIPPEKLKFLKVPDRYDLIQLIALNKGLQQGETLDYFTFDRVEGREKSTDKKVERIATTPKLGKEVIIEMSDVILTDETERYMNA